MDAATGLLHHDGQDEAVVDAGLEGDLWMESYMAPTSKP